MTLSDITQFQPKAWSILARSFASDRVAGTYLFWGREGLGHWPLAISFAALLNCRDVKKGTGDPAKATPCGKCDSCRQIGALAFPGMHLVVPIASHRNMNEAIDLTNEVLEQKRAEPLKIIQSSVQTTIPVDMARDVKSRLALKGDVGTTRVVVFYQMEKMLAASADALLKMIEEPPRDTVIILTAESPEVLLPTIQSRSQRIRLHRVAEETIAGYLRDGYGQKEETARRMARLSEGNPGVAIEMIGEDESSEDLSQRAVGFLLFKSLFLDPGPAVTSHIMELMGGNDRSQAEAVLRLWQSVIRDCSYYASTGETDQIVNSDFQSDIVAFARRFDDPQLASTMTVAIKNALADIRLNVHIPTAIVALALRLGTAIRAPR